MYAHCVNETVFLWQLSVHVECSYEWFSIDPPLTAHWSVHVHIAACRVQGMYRNGLLYIHVHRVP